VRLEAAHSYFTLMKYNINADERNDMVTKLVSGIIVTFQLIQ